MTQDRGRGRKPDRNPPMAVVVLGIGAVLLFLYAVRSSHFSLPSGVGSEAGPGSAAAAEPIRIAAGQIPPYMDADGRGLEADAIEARLSPEASETIEYFVLPFSRHWTSYLQDERFAAVATVPEGMALEGFPSQPYITYQNGIGFRCADMPDGAHLDDLTGRKVVAFSGAASVLDDINRRSGSFLSYVEIANQRVHSERLIDGRADAVVGDRLIFAHYNAEILAGMTPEERAAVPELCFDAIFPETRYHMVFRSESLRDRFDAGRPPSAAPTLQPAVE